MTILLAFTAEQASRVTGIPESTIRYWDTTDIVSPSLALSRDRGAFGRIYSFRDLVALRTVAELRDTFGVPLQTLRMVAARLRNHADIPWSELRFYVSGKHLFFRDPESPIMLSALAPSQIAMAEVLDLSAVSIDTERKATKLLERTPDQLGKIEELKYIAGKRPVLAGTRIPTLAIWEFHQAGYSLPEILAEYPRLTPIDIENAIAFEAELRAERKAS